MDTAYIIAAKRRDGTMPKLCKAWCNRIWFDYEEAERCRQWLNDTYAVYRITATVEELVTKGGGE